MAKNSSKQEQAVSQPQAISEVVNTCQNYLRDVFDSFKDIRELLKHFIYVYPTTFTGLVRTNIAVDHETAEKKA